VTERQPPLSTFTDRYEPFPILHLKINMNANFSKKDGKNLDEIQATRMITF